MSIRSKLLIASGIIANGTAIWHLLCIVGGPSWYVFARAPQPIIEAAKQGSFIAPLSTIIIACLFFACNAYAFSAAGLIRKIPLLKPALITISLICLIRSVIFTPGLISATTIDVWLLVTSIVWFFCGVCFALGTIEQFRTSKNKSNT